MDDAKWVAERDALLATLWERCGEFPSRDHGLDPEEIWRREWWSHTEIKLTFQGEPGERIPAYLLIPREAEDGPLPAVYAAHQCACTCDVGKEQVVGKCVELTDQAYGLELVREGFIVLAPDANKVGERYDPALREPWQTADDLGGQHACCCAPGGPWGAIRWKPIYDVMRGIDFLVNHERVDETRIGMIGHSLGADTTLWAMPLEERIAAAAISGGGLLLDWLPYGLPYADILRLIAPRPFFEVTGTQDSTNCDSDDAGLSVDERMAGKRAAHATGRLAYEAMGAGERLVCSEFDGEHSFPPEERQRVYEWLRRWLMPAAVSP